MPGMLKIALQRAANLRELGEDERALATINHLFNHLPQPLQLVRTLGCESAAILQELRRMVTDLLELQKRR